MSHVATIELEINDLCSLKKACERLGFTFMEGQRTYRWYGEWVGDHPLPEGFTQEDLGKCDHAIRVPGALYEVGVVNRGGKYVLLWDFWQDGGLQQKLGKNAGLLKQAYTIVRSKAEAIRKGYQVAEKRTKSGIRLVLSKRS